ncbi:MAG: RNase adapter RapZ [Acetobacteraceae bacterium]|nr:RNase adapter RapZ [Acetobacteraceae bacterium]
MSDRRRVVLVTGLSGAGKASILHALEDLDYEAIDNPPLNLVEALAASSDRPLAIGVDARTQGFDAGGVLETMARLRGSPNLRPELIYAWAEESVLLRRYTETRRRHPLAPLGRVSDGIAAEEALTAPLRQAADLLIDTSDRPLADLRRLIGQAFGQTTDFDGSAGLLISLISFAYPAGLPREADLVFDARFLRNPHYDPILRPRTGLEPAVGVYVEADPDYWRFLAAITQLLTILLPRFVQESKKYATVAIGCTGGRHRSVWIAERLAEHLAQEGWRLHVTHRELAKEGSAARALASGLAAHRRAPEAGDQSDRSGC